MAIRVVLIEDHLLALQAMSAMLKNEPGIDVAATTTGEDHPLRLVNDVQPDVAILDVDVQVFDTDPITTVENLKRVCPASKVLMLVRREESFLATMLVDAGARGCLLKSDEQILSLGTVVHRLFDGEVIYSQGVLQKYFDPSKPVLSPRELTVLRLVAQGWTNGEIADHLTISDSTVRNYLSSIYRKLGIVPKKGRNSRIIAINRARKLGLL
jgi:DNA-binding NarL/FixJ family response regulator